MEQVERLHDSQWTAVDIWSALIEFDPDAAKSDKVDSIVAQLSEMMGRPLSASEEVEVRQTLIDADPIMWELRIAGPSEDERARVQGEILRVLRSRQV